MTDSVTVRTIIKQYIKESLSIEMSKDLEGDLVVQLKLGDEVISKAWVTQSEEVLWLN